MSTAVDTWGATTTTILSRNNSRYKGYRTDEQQQTDPDKLDIAIIECIARNPGLYIREVSRCIGRIQDTEVNALTVRYRIKTLEETGFIRTEKVGTVRRCYPADQGKTSWK